MIYNDVMVKEDGIYLMKTSKTGELEELRVGNYLDIESQMVNIDSNEYTVKLVYQPANCLKRLKVVANLSEISSGQGLLSLAKYGVDVNEFNKSILVKSLRNSREIAPYYYNHHSLGFKFNNDEIHFHHYYVLGMEEDSTYIGDFNIKPLGSHSIYMQMIENEVLGHTPLELGLVLGASSALIGLLGEKYSIENLFFHLVGDSSTGKSTVAMLATSIWGSPILAENGLLTTWNATLNSIQKRLSGNTGVALCLDEISQYTGKDATKVIYSLTEGTTRSRLNKDSELKIGGHWRTTILSTGERSLIEAGSQNTGLRVRLLELELKQWTRNAENSNQIKRIISQHYGLLGLEFVEYILSIGVEEMYRLFEEYEQYMISLLPETAIKTRLASKLAIILMTSTLLENMGIGINVDNIERLLLKQFSQIGVEADLGIKAYEQLMQYLSSNQSKFICQYARRGTSGVYDYSPSHCQGRIKFDSNNQMEEVAINAKEFKSIISSLGFESERVLLKNWKEKGWLDYEENKLQKRLIINNTRISCIVLKVGLIERYLKEMELRGC